MEYSRASCFVVALAATVFSAGAVKEQMLFQTSRASTNSVEMSPGQAPATDGRLNCESEASESWGSFWNSTDGCGGDGEFKVLTYQMFYEKFLIGMGGFNESAKLLMKKGPFDLIGFQECDSVRAVLGPLLNSTYSAIRGTHGLAIAYQTAKWEELDHGSGDVAEDRTMDEAINPVDRTWGGNFGLRAITWARLRHVASGKVVFFATHHGPLPVGSGGRCGEEATVRGLLGTFVREAQPGDLKILAGDLNAGSDSRTQALLGEHMRQVATDGVDAVFSSCPSPASHGEEAVHWAHNMLEVTFRM